MKIVEIRSEAELHGLKTAWEALLVDSASSTIFLTWEWLNSWWTAYGAKGELRILAAFEEHGALRGIAPLRQETLRKYGQAAPALAFLGDGSHDSDYLDFIVAAGYEQEVMESFVSHLSDELDHGTILRLNEIPDASPNLAALRGRAAARRTIWTETNVDCGTVRLPGEWEDYLKMLRPRFRTKVRSVLREMENRPEVRFGFVESAEELDRLLPILFDLHTKRWAREAKPGVFGWDKKRAFYAAVAPLLLERGWLRFSWLEWKNQILACQFGFMYGGTYFQLQEGYEPASEHLNLGAGLRAWSIRKLIQEGAQEYDFMGGMGRHKTDWGADLKHSKCVVVGKDSHKNRLLQRGPEWETQWRESIKSLIPDKVLAYRHARLEAGSRSASNDGSTSLVQKAISRFYYYSPMPALVRPLRERYQLSVSSNGKGPRMSWNRRAEPTGRILCYHRIDDNNDPFFPATPVRVFEQTMRHVARHYQVVSLETLLDHLESDSLGTKVAVTFDDGYLNNYKNAFPILQSLNIPATIFLTTGSIDSRDPLWFEQLAEALKRTDREYIDLEVDIPRRIWTRTQAERLEANTLIYYLIRALDDSERRDWLSRILKHLGAGPAVERCERMLTWDQVRLMKSQGIDFGGHTVTHPFISKLRGDQAAWEIAECKRRIEDELQGKVNCFAYPSGKEEDFTTTNKDLIRRAGYRAAVSTIWGMNGRSTDRMELRRGGPWELDPAMFAYKLDWYQFAND